jgi:hypothetical protein
MSLPTIPDHVLVLLITVGLPLHVLLFWFPRVKRAILVHPAVARHRAYLEGNAVLWALSALTLFHWARAGRAGADLGLAAPEGARFWAALILCLGVIAGLVWQRIALLREAGTAAVREAVLRHLAPVRPILPHTRGELAHFGLVSVSAGLGEELLFRGFVFAYLDALVPVVPALVLSSALFGMAHAYQGNRGVLQTGLVGLVLGGFFLLSGSLWVPMLLHAAVDMNSGLTAYGILREGREA